MKPYIRLFLISVLPALVTAGCMPKPPPLGPPVVQVTDVVQKDVPVYAFWVGTLDGSVNAEIRAMVSGYLLKQDYQDGTFVKKGDLLFELDPRPFQATLDQATAQFGKTEQAVKRLTPLLAQNAVSQQDLDNAIQDNLAAKAQADAARINLEFTKIASPIDGIASIAVPGIGDLVSPSSGALATVSQMDPIKVNFIVGEQDYLYAIKKYLDGEKRELNKIREMELQLILANGMTYSRKGTLTAVDRQLDPRTGSIRLTGEFPNPDRLLRPGQFARVRAKVDLIEGALLVPQRAVMELQGMYQVAVVGADNKVSIRAVDVGEQDGSMWIVEKGLKAGDKVVVEGVQKVKDGLEVTVQPFAPVAETAPVAADSTPKAE
jgi:membrane fusion protein (multidrug efflux system)